MEKACLLGTGPFSASSASAEGRLMGVTVGKILIFVSLPYIILLLRLRGALAHFNRPTDG